MNLDTENEIYIFKKTLCIWLPLEHQEKLNAEGTWLKQVKLTEMFYQQIFDLVVVLSTVPGNGHECANFHSNLCPS